MEGDNSIYCMMFHFVDFVIQVSAFVVSKNVILIDTVPGFFEATEFSTVTRLGGVEGRHDNTVR